MSRWCVVVRRHELTDAAWRRIEPLLPAQPARGGRWVDHRTVLNGILWKLATGVPWRDLPERYGNWKTVYERYRRWAADGTFDAILTHVQVHDDSVGRIDWTVSVDSTIVRAHQHAAGAHKKGNPAGRTGPTRPTVRPRSAGHCGHGDRRDHPRTRRPASRTRSPRFMRRAPTGLRPGPLQAPQRGRTLHRPSQAIARHRHPVRQTRPQLPRSDRPGHRPALDQHVIHRTRPRPVGLRRAA